MADGRWPMADGRFLLRRLVAWPLAVRHWLRFVAHPPPAPSRNAEDHEFSLHSSALLEAPAQGAPALRGEEVSLRGRSIARARYVDRPCAVRQRGRAHHADEIFAVHAHRKIWPSDSRSASSRSPYRESAQDAWPAKCKAFWLGYLDNVRSPEPIPESADCTAGLRMSQV